jgi:hypothetical protein
MKKHSVVCQFGNIPTKGDIFYASSKFLVRNTPRGLLSILPAGRDLSTEPDIVGAETSKPAYW